MPNTSIYGSLVLALLGLLAIGCEPAVQTTAPPPPKKEEVARQGNVVYGPRWTDYRSWGRLEVGLTRQATIDLLGEPYLPEFGTQQAGGTMELLIFKIRTKLFKVTELTNVSTSGMTGNPTTPILISKEVYPDKSGDTGVWGEISNLYCYFQNGKLMKWDRTLSRDDDTQKSLKNGSTDSSQKK